MARHDWKDWKNVYVCGPDSVTLESMALMPNAPSIAALKRHCSADSWKEQRKQFRYIRDAESARDEAAQEAIAKVERLVDASELIVKHLRLAKAMQGLTAKRLQTIKLEEITPNILVQWLKLSVDIERICLGLATQHAQIDLTQMSDEQLEKIVAGEAV